MRAIEKRLARLESTPEADGLARMVADMLADKPVLEGSPEHLAAIAAARAVMVIPVPDEPGPEHPIL